MNREIKFRAWVNGKMREVYMLTFADNTKEGGWAIRWPNHKDDTLSALHAISPLNKSYLMQYTGLKDKNGVEIFEGDIVRWSNWKEGYTGFDGKTMPYHDSEVIWKEEGCWVLKAKESWNMGIFNNREVIGNIYENPDLLTQVK